MSAGVDPPSSNGKKVSRWSPNADRATRRNLLRETSHTRTALPRPGSSLRQLSPSTPYAHPATTKQRCFVGALFQPQVSQPNVHFLNRTCLQVGGGTKTLCCTHKKKIPARHPSGVERLIQSTLCTPSIHRLQNTVWRQLFNTSSSTSPTVIDHSYEGHHNLKKNTTYL